MYEEPVRNVELRLKSNGKNNDTWVSLKGTNKELMPIKQIKINFISPEDGEVILTFFDVSNMQHGRVPEFKFKTKIKDLNAVLSVFENEFDSMMDLTIAEKQNHQRMNLIKQLFD